MIEVVPTGMDGAMGTAVREVAEGREDCETNWGVSGTAERPGALAAQLPDLFAERGGDVLVDFSGPASGVGYVETCAEIGIPCVIGTTGFDEEQEKRLRAASESVPVLKAANFSRGVHVLSALVREAAATLPEYDIELTETHHNRKRDAPSGTAKRVLEGIESARETSGRVHGREGESPRNVGEVGVHARRAGTITGEHEVLLAGGGEELRLTHRAESRRVFAEGALDAATWLASRSPGWYDFSDVMTDESV
ncbi:4-hydroxy-tetrahydrodipicolinate reductase [Natronorarus salvus]|uniref:4-hydroxy-tetrahydrodipicolinate reductase n=1 Tax=Natronorarus salvus TaxID=3117733 RepID=UPI002F2606F1